MALDSVRVLLVAMATASCAATASHMPVRTITDGDVVVSPCMHLRQVTLVVGGAVPDRLQSMLRRLPDNVCCVTCSLHESSRVYPSRSPYTLQRNFTPKPRVFLIRRVYDQSPATYREGQGQHDVTLVSERRRKHCDAPCSGDHVAQHTTDETAKPTVLGSVPAEASRVLDDRQTHGTTVAVGAVNARHAGTQVQLSLPQLIRLV